MRDPFGQFNCRVCGEPTAISFFEPTAHEDIEGGREHFQAWCEKHCPGHIYEHDYRELCCKYCDARPPDDYYDEQPYDGDWL